MSDERQETQAPVPGAAKPVSSSFVLHPSTLFLLLLAAIWGVCRFAFAEINDDAMITFVYARNLVNGAGLVFNPGEWIYGTTTPVFALFAAAGMLLGFEPWTWVILWDVVWGGLILWRLRRILEAGGYGDAFLLAGPCIVLASAITLPVAGMETALYEVLLFSAIDSAMRREPAWRTMLWGSLAAVLRPDGVIVLAVVAPFALFPLIARAKWSGLLRGCYPLALPVAHALGVWFLYGSVLPQSLLAKASSSVRLPLDHTFAFGLWRDLTYLFGSVNLVGIAALAGFLAAFRNRRLLPLNVFVMSYVGLFAIGNAPSFLWYRTPLYVLMFAYAALGATLVFEALPAVLGKRWPALRLELSPPRRRFFAATAFACLLVPQVAGYVMTHQQAFAEIAIDTNQKRLREAADHIRGQTAGPPFVASHEIGHLGYFLDGRIYDFEGLVTPAVVEARARGIDPFLLADAPWFVQAVNYAEPESIAYSLMQRTYLQHYEVEEIFPWAHGMTYVFRRNDAAHLAAASRIVLLDEPEGAIP